MNDDQIIDRLPVGSRPFAARLRQRTGRLLGIHRRMAASPVVIAVYSGIGAAIAEYGTFDARTRETIALAAIARSADAHVGYVPDALRPRALDAGWSEEDLEELFAHVAANLYMNYFNHYLNYFNHYAGTEFDFPPAPSVP